MTRRITYDAGTNFGELLALSIAAADGETDEANVAGHGTKEIDNTRCYSGQLLSPRRVSKNGDILGKETSENEEQNTWDL